VQKSLIAVKGVRSARVDLEKKEAIVAYDSTQTDVEALLKATSDAGFKSQIK
jgi:mercuric ion binding protein